MKRIISLFLLGMILLGTATLSISVSAETAAVAPGPMPIRLADRINAWAAGEISADDPAFYIILLKDAPLARYDGSISGLTATGPAILGTSRLDTTSAASVAYLAHLRTQQDSLLSHMSSTFGRAVEVYPDRYEYAMNGFAAWLLPAEAQLVKSMPNVQLVERETFLNLQTDAGPDWIEADTIWTGTSSPANVGTKGDGIVAGIIDTGVNTTNPSFSETTADGHTFTNPRGQWYGTCTMAAPPCNNKLIGVWDFTGTSVEDDNNHGSHTASTTVGNEITITVDGNDGSYTQDFNISGVAPHANLITYKVCVEAGCINVSTGLGIDQAVADGVDVINYSIGGSSGDPWTDANAISFMSAFEIDILVAVAAGNDGPGPQTIGSPSNAPWVASVAATTHDRSLTNTISGLTDALGNPLPDITGTAYNSGYGPAPIVYAGDYVNAGDAALCEQPFLPLTFSGEIVICDRGVIARVEKCRNVELGGAGGCILANDLANGDSTSADPHDVPSVHISYDDGVLLKQYLADNPALMGTISATNIGSDPNSADTMAGFSSRGPDATVFDVMKPDIGAPGVDILAAYSVANGNHGLLSGTSMASPHYAGALVLMRKLHPDWSAAEIRSALMLTAFNDPYAGGKETHVFFDDDGVTPADPHDVGAGRVDLNRAALAGFVMDESADNFEAANPADGGDPTSLNLASISSGQCAGTCEFTREISSTVDSAVTWNVTGVSADGIAISILPDMFTLQPNATQAIRFTFDVSELQGGEWQFGHILFTPDDNSIPPARIPVSLLPANFTLSSLGKMTVDTRRAAGSEFQTAIFTPTVPITDLQTLPLDLTLGDIDVRTVVQDPTPLDAYDMPEGTYFVTATVTADTQMLYTEVLATLAADLDMYVGRDLDGDGDPDETEELCSSATDTALESCSLLQPPPGTYWVLIQNWLGGLSEVTLLTTTLSGTDADPDDLALIGPASSAEGSPLDLRLIWNKPEMQAGESWFGLILLGQESSRAPGDAGALIVQVNREADDVVKSADVEEINVLETINYTVEVQPSVRNSDENYQIVDVIPPTVTLDPNSVSVNKGETNVDGNTITWTLVQEMDDGGLPLPEDPATLTYSVTATTNNVFVVNSASSVVTNDPHSVEETSTATIKVGNPMPTAVSLNLMEETAPFSSLLLWTGLLLVLSLPLMWVARRR